MYYMYVYIHIHITYIHIVCMQYVYIHIYLHISTMHTHAIPFLDSPTPSLPSFPSQSLRCRATPSGQTENVIPRGAGGESHANYQWPPAPYDRM